MTTLIIQIGAVWLVAILAGLPLFASMGLAAFAFVHFGALNDSIVPQKMGQAINSFPLIAAPLFILMGNILGAAKLTDRIVAFASACIGWVRGGYAHASILASMIFAGMVGSAVADVAGTGAIEIRAMRRAGYRAETAAAINAAAATIGPIIPPSLPMVIYGITADASIGRLFLAGVIPGIMMGISLMIMVSIVARRQGFERHAFGGWRNIAVTLRDGFPALMAPALLLGGMFSGYFTPTEAAAVATLYALFLGFVVYRTLEVKQLPALFIDSAETTGLVTVLVMVAGALGWCMSISRLPQTLTPLLVDGIGNPLLFLLAVNLILLLVGCFMEALAAILLLIPILVPAAASFGIDPTQFGLIMIFNLILGTIHPPIGVVLFVTSRIAGITYEAMSRAILPWLIPLLVVLALITIFPVFTTFLPNLVMPTK